MISGRTPREWDENMKFIGRSAELSALDRMYGKNSFEMMICSVHWTGHSMMPQCSCSRAPVTEAGNWKQYRYRLVNLNR